MFHSMVRRFRANIPGYWRQYRWFILLFVLSQLADAISTTMFMLDDETATTEVHPVFRWISMILGPYGGPLLGFLGKVAMGLIVCIYLRRWTLYILITATFLGFWACWYNIWGKHFYVPNLLNLMP